MSFPTEAARFSVEAGTDLPLETARDLSARGFQLVLALGEPAVGDVGSVEASLTAEAADGFDAAGWAFEATGDDPMALNGAAVAAVEAVRRGPKPLPVWLTALRVGDDAGAPGRAVQFAAHALALGVGEVFLDPPWSSPALEPVLRAYDLLAAQLDGAERIAQTARGQYRIEIGGRPNRYLLWEAAGIRRLPSSLQGPLRVTGLDGEAQRIETTRLKLTPQPVFVDRE